MREEVDAVERAVRESAAFAAPAVAPVHSDLWEHNVLVRPDGEWFVIDWDDLRRGDPVVDPLGAEERARFAICGRAQLLTEAIDSLADHVEAARAPEHAGSVRAEKWRVHERAWSEYRARWR